MRQNVLFVCMKNGFTFFDTGLRLECVTENKFSYFSIKIMLWVSIEHPKHAKTDG